MNLLDTLSGYLAGIGALALTEGTNLFIHAFPAEARNGVMLRYYFGGVAIDAELPGYRKTAFQVVVRDTDYGRGEALARTISDELAREMDLGDIAAALVHYIRPRMEPFVYPQSVGAEWEFLVTYDICYVIL